MSEREELEAIRRELFEVKRFLDWLENNGTDEELKWEGLRRASNIYTRCTARMDELGLEVLD